MFETISAVVRCRVKTFAYIAPRKTNQTQRKTMNKQQNRSEAIHEAFNGGTERVVPERILTEAPGGYAVLPVVKVLAHPPGTAPSDAPIHPDVTVVEVRTAYGVRWFGFQRAWIGADLRMHVDGYNPGFEEVAAWPKP